MNRVEIYEQLPKPIYWGVPKTEIIDRLKVLYTHALESAEQSEHPGKYIEDMQALAAAIDIMEIIEGSEASGQESKDKDKSQ